MLLKIRLAIVLTALLLSTPLFADNFNKEFQTSKGFTVVLTDDWVEVPQDVLQEFLKALTEAAGQEQHWDYAYQHSSSPDWFQYPYVLVKANESARIPDAELKKYSKVKEDLERGLREAEKQTGDMVSESHIGETFYDSENNILFTVFKMNVQDFGAVKGLGALKLTEKGFIQFMGYTLESESERFMKFYTEAAQKLQLDDALVYKPRLTDSIPVVSGIDWSAVGRMAVIGGLIGGLVGGVITYLKKRRKS